MTVMEIVCLVMQLQLICSILTRVVVGSVTVAGVTATNFGASSETVGMC